MPWNTTPTNSDDVIDIRNVIDRVEELREQRTPRIVAGWNMPGYMPDEPPGEFSSWDDAFTSIADEMDNYADSLVDSDDEGDKQMLEQLQAESKRIRELLSTEDMEEYAKISNGYGGTFGKYHYFITEDGTMGLDDDEARELSDMEALLEDVKGYGGDHQWEGDWYPVTLIRESYFPEYCEEFVKEIGDLPQEIPSYLEIDWEKTANNLRVDYSETDFDGVTYLYRN